MPRKKQNAAGTPNENPPATNGELLELPKRPNTAALESMNDEQLSPALVTTFGLADLTVGIVATEFPDGTPIDQSILDEYRANQFDEATARTLEPVAQTVGRVGRKSREMGLQVGAMLHFAKATAGHGNWEYFVTERIGLTMATAQRFLAASKAMYLYPQLTGVVNNINMTALAKIGQAKKPTPEHIDRIRELAEDREMTVEDVRDVLNSEKPEPVRRPREIPFTPVTQAEAFAVLTAMGDSMASVNEQLARKVDGKAIRNHPEYKDYMRAVFNDPQTDFQRTLRDFFVSAWTMAYSYEHPSDGDLEGFGPATPPVAVQTVNLDKPWLASPDFFRIHVGELVDLLEAGDDIGELDPMRAKAVEREIARRGQLYPDGLRDPDKSNVPDDEQEPRPE